MKSLYLIPVLCLALSACGSKTKSYEQEAGLTPLPTPETLAAAPATPDTTGQSIEDSITKATTPAAADAVIAQCHAASAMMSSLSAFAKPEKVKHTTAMVGFYERAATIKKQQLTDNDTTDSSGEVAKYIGYARQSAANAQSIPK